MKLMKLNLLILAMLMEKLIIIKLVHGKDIRSNVMVELALYINEKCGKKMVERLAETYVHIYIDEVQDMAGYDLNIIETLMKSDVAITCVGDNKQATFRTNNSVKNKKMSGTYIWTFFQKMINDKNVLMNKNLVSRRFNREICNFANLVYPNENNISTSMNEITEHDGVFLIKKEDVELYYDYYAPAILKYDRKTATDNYYSYNFGECKGMTFQRVLIYPNGPFLDFLLRRKKLNSPQKYYVAVTRAKYSIAFVVEILPENKDWLLKENLKIRDRMIEIMRYRTV
ncbi:MAG: UvrD-helicase domain-containing protein [Lachnospiraceae bacterium]|nr:UvrD-helicase domain-containing protein [Lachnospiraceae bacterium]